MPFVGGAALLRTSIIAMVRISNKLGFDAGDTMKILIADDHRLVIEAVKTKLAELGPEIEFVLAMSVSELLANASDDLDLALVDLNMPGADGQSHIDEVRRRHPAVPLIVLSGTEDPSVMREALERELAAMGAQV